MWCGQRDILVILALRFIMFTMFTHEKESGSVDAKVKARERREKNMTLNVGDILMTHFK